MLFFGSSGLSQEILYGATEYNVNSARESVSQGIVYKISPETFKSALYDLNNQENLQNILNGNLSSKDRTLAFFSDSSYGVSYINDPYNVYYYNAEGFLIYIDKKSGLEYPYKFYKYSPTGDLVNMGLRVSKGETYIYSPAKKLIAHWIDNNASDENNNILMKRKYSE